MTTFSVILEDVIKQPRQFNIENKRVETIDADNLELAWEKARAKFYVQQDAGLNAQIVDIKEGIVELQPEEPVTISEEPPTAPTDEKQNG